MWLTTTIPANLLSGISTKVNILEWTKTAIFMSPKPHLSCTSPGKASGGSAGQRYLLKKTGHSRPRKGRQRGQAWLQAHACTSPGSEQTASLVPVGGSS